MKCQTTFAHCFCFLWPRPFLARFWTLETALRGCHFWPTTTTEQKQHCPCLFLEGVAG